MAVPLFTRMLQPQSASAPKPAPAGAPATRIRAAPAVLAAPDAPDAALAQADWDAAAVAPALPASGPSQSPVESLAEVLPAPALTTSEPSGSAASAAPDTRLSYALTGNCRGALYGSARVQWQREHSRYQVRLELIVALVLRVVLTSQGRVSDSGLQPGVYEEQLAASLQRMAFEDGYVRFPNGTRLPQPPGLQDTVSQFVELNQRFVSGREQIKVGGEVQVWLARPQGMALWTYDVLPQETLQTAEFGALPVFHLRPRPIAEPHGVMTAELWFAPSLQYLPVRVRIALGGDNFIDLLVERIEQGAAPVPP